MVIIPQTYWTRVDALKKFVDKYALNLLWMFSRLFLASLSRALAAFSARLETKTRLHALLKWAEAHCFYSGSLTSSAGCAANFGRCLCGCCCASLCTTYLATYHWRGQLVWFRVVSSSIFQCLLHRKKRMTIQTWQMVFCFTCACTCRGVVEGYLT